jgi:hypothetical protein
VLCVSLNDQIVPAYPVSPTLPPVLPPENNKMTFARLVEPNVLSGSSDGHYWEETVAGHERYSTIDTTRHQVKYLYSFILQSPNTDEAISYTDISPGVL